MALKGPVSRHSGGGHGRTRAGWGGALTKGGVRGRIPFGSGSGLDSSKIGKHITLEKSTLWSGGRDSTSLFLINANLVQEKSYSRGICRGSARPWEKVKGEASQC